MRTYGHLQRAFERTLAARATALAGPTRRLANPNWLDDLAEPFARWLLEAARPAGYDRYRTTGPCGLGARLSITLLPIATRGSPEDEWTNPANLYVTVEPSGSPIRLASVDYGTDTHRFAPNSIGAISGLNHPSRDIADHATAGDILRPLLAARTTILAPDAVRNHPVQQELFAASDA